MPMGKMTRFRRKRPKRKLPKETEKAVSRIVKKRLDARIQDNYYHQRFDITIPLDTVTPAGSPFQMSSMAVGDGIGQRGGTGVLLKRIELRANFRTPTTALPTDYQEQTIRFLVVRVYKSDPTFQPSYNLIMGNGTGAEASMEFPKLQEGLSKKKEVTILYDRLFNLNIHNGYGKILHFSKNYKNPSGIYYDGSNRNSGQLWGVVIRSGGTADSAKAPGLECIWKLTYEDA